MQNPVLARELNLLGRSWRLPLVLFTLALLAGGLVLLELAVGGGGVTGAALPTRTGVRLFSLLTALQLGVILLIAPGLTSGAISGERERQTLEPLLHTGISATALIIGKLGSALAYLLLLLTALTPAVGLLLLLGGAGVRQVLLAYGVLIATGLLQASLGLFTSALSRRTQTAASAAYIITAILTVMTILPTWLAGPNLSTWGVRPQVFLANAMANPVAALAASTGGPLFTPILTAIVAPAAPAAGSVAAASSESFSFSNWVPPAYAGLQQTAQANAGPVMRPAIPVVTYGFLAFSSIASMVMILLSIAAVRPHGKLFRRMRKGAGSPG